MKISSWKISLHSLLYHQRMNEERIVTLLLMWLHRILSSIWTCNEEHLFHSHSIHLLITFSFLAFCSLLPCSPFLLSQIHRNTWVHEFACIPTQTAIHTQTEIKLIYGWELTFWNNHRIKNKIRIEYRIKVFLIWPKSWWTEWFALLAEFF